MNASEPLQRTRPADRPVLRLLERPARPAHVPAPKASPPAWHVRVERWAARLLAPR